MVKAINILWSWLVGDIALRSIQRERECTFSRVFTQPWTTKSTSTRVLNKRQLYTTDVVSPPFLRVTGMTAVRRRPIRLERLYETRLHVTGVKVVLANRFHLPQVSFVNFECGLILKLKGFLRDFRTQILEIRSEGKMAIKIKIKSKITDLQTRNFQNLSSKIP